MRLPLLPAFALSAVLASGSAAFVACSDDPSPAVDAVDAATNEDDAGETPSARDGSDEGSDDAAGDDRSTCARTRAWAEACGFTDSLNCGATFDTWCAASDEAINSDAYREAVARCFDAEHCEVGARTDCEYASYASATPTAAQKALVAAYCATCEPDDPEGCATRATTYDAKAGPSAVPDVFIAAWELRDSLVDEIRATCTGSALDAGTGDVSTGDASADDAGDAGGSAACAKAFANCAGDLYLGHLPDCPSNER